MCRNVYIEITYMMLLDIYSVKIKNYLNGSDHRVIVSYSGLHEECEVNVFGLVFHFSAVLIGRINKKPANLE